MSERFEPRVDARPDDLPWPVATWPPPADTVLVGSHVTLSPTVEADADELFTALDEDIVWAHVRGRPSGPDDVRTWISTAPSVGRFAWTVRAGGAVVGTTSFLDISPSDGRLEIGWTSYARSAWGTQVNPECKLLLMEWAFEHGFGRVQLKTDIRNARSQQAIARMGAQFEGVLRRYQRRADDSIRDTVMFSVIVEEWPAVRDGLLKRLR